MKTIATYNTVCVRQSLIKGAGRGVFALRNIKKGECIELCPAIFLSHDDMANVRESMLVTYFFFHGKRKEKIFLALGYGSLYNHSYQPNATYTIHNRDQTIEFIAVTDIKKDSEITCNYKSDKSQSPDPLWFENEIY